MITESRILEILKEAGVLMEGHFKLTSGRHSNKYLQCAKIFRNAKYSEILSGALAEQFANDGVEIVIGPALGAIQLAYEVSRQLGCENFFSEREEGGEMVLRRNFTIKPGQRVLIVEDVVTTGGSVKELVRLVQEKQGDIVGVGSIVDRSCCTADFGVPFRSVIKVDVESWESDDCPICKEGVIPLEKPGSRKK